MERRDNGQVEDDETGLPAVEHEVLHVNRQTPVREHAEEEGHAQIRGDQGGRDFPGLHQGFLLLDRLVLDPPAPDPDQDADQRDVHREQHRVEERRPEEPRLGAVKHRVRHRRQGKEEDRQKCNGGNPAVAGPGNQVRAPGRRYQHNRLEACPRHE